MHGSLMNLVRVKPVLPNAFVMHALITLNCWMCKVEKRTVSWQQKGFPLPAGKSFLQVSPSLVSSTVQALVPLRLSP